MLKKIGFSLLTFCCLWVLAQSAPNKTLLSHLATDEKSKDFRTGDIVFQSNKAGQGLAIQIATESKYSHCGIIFEGDDQLYVLEAVQPVRIIPLKQWIRQGDKNHYVVKRLLDSESILTNNILNDMRTVGKSFLGRNYDLHFNWSDDYLYCSELVWKVYDRGANIEVGKRQKLKEFNLDHPIVQEILKERYGDNIPYDEMVISPGAIFQSENLITVFEN